MAILIVSALFELMLGGGIVFDMWLITSGTASEMENRNPFVSSKEQELMVRMVFGLILMFLHAFVIFGAVSMMRLRNYGVAYTAAVLSVIPCCSGCYFLGIPFGIWALVVLNREDVKAAFR